MDEARDHDDFRTLIEREIPKMRRYARALLRNADDADDLLQDSLERALTKAHLWEKGTNLRAWLFAVMHNQHVNSIRSKVRHGVQVPVDELDLPAPLQSPTASIELRELDQAMAKLPEEQRAVLLLLGLEGMKYDEISTVLQIPVGTVRSRISRGREALRMALNAPERRAVIRPQTTASPHSAAPAAA